MFKNTFGFLHFYEESAFAQLQFIRGPDSCEDSVDRLAVVIVTRHITSGNSPWEVYRSSLVCFVDVVVLGFNSLQNFEYALHYPPWPFEEVSSQRI